MKNLFLALILIFIFAGIALVDNPTKYVGTKKLVDSAGTNFLVLPEAVLVKDSLFVKRDAYVKGSLYLDTLWQSKIYVTGYDMIIQDAKQGSQMLFYVGDAKGTFHPRYIFNKGSLSSTQWLTLDSTGLDLRVGTYNFYQNKTSGKATLPGSGMSNSYTVNTSDIKSTSLVFLTRLGNIGPSTGTIYVDNIVPATSFDILSTDLSETNTIQWMIIESK